MEYHLEMKRNKKIPNIIWRLKEIETSQNKT